MRDSRNPSGGFRDSSPLELFGRQRGRSKQWKPPPCRFRGTVRNVPPSITPPPSTIRNRLRGKHGNDVRERDISFSSVRPGHSARDGKPHRSSVPNIAIIRAATFECSFRLSLLLLLPRLLPSGTSPKCTGRLSCNTVPPRVQWEGMISQRSRAPLCALSWSN